MLETWNSVVCPTGGVLQTRVFPQSTSPDKHFILLTYRGWSQRWVVFFFFIYKESLHLYFVCGFIFHYMVRGGRWICNWVPEKARRGQRLSGPLQQEWQKVAGTEPSPRLLQRKFDSRDMCPIKKWQLQWLILKTCILISLTPKSW